MIKALKWIVIVMISLSTFLNYVDRQTLSLLATSIQTDLRIDDKGYAFLISAFLFAYCGGNLVSGFVVDRLGAKLALPIFVAWWSVANMMSGLVHSADHMAVTRFALGLAEVGNFLAAPILVRQFFPPTQRAFAIGLYTATAMFGATISPPMVTWIGATQGWRWAFIIMGASGLVWSLVWVLVVGIRREKVEKGDSIDQKESSTDEIAPQDISTWWKALTNRSVWGIAFGTMLTYPIWYYYLFWFPKYLMDERGLSSIEMGRVSWVVYLFAGLGALAGGYLSGLLVKFRLAPKAARLWVMLAACCLAPIGGFIALQPSVWLALGLASCVAFFQMVWQAAITTLPTDLFSSKHLAKAFTISGTAAAIAGIGSTWLIGQLIALVSYKPMFLVTSALYPVAICLVYFLTKDKIIASQPLKNYPEKRV